MQREPPPFVWAVPDEKNILTCELLKSGTLVLWGTDERLFGYAGDYIIVRSSTLVTPSPLVSLAAIDSVDHQIHHMQAENTTVNSSFPLNIPSSPRASRCVHVQIYPHDETSVELLCFIDDHTIWKVSARQEDLLLNV